MALRALVRVARSARQKAAAARNLAKARAARKRPNRLKRAAIGGAIGATAGVAYDVQRTRKRNAKTKTSKTREMGTGRTPWSNYDPMDKRPPSYRI